MVFFTAANIALIPLSANILQRKIRKSAKKDEYNLFFCLKPQKK